MTSLNLRCCRVFMKSLYNQCEIQKRSFFNVHAGPFELSALLKPESLTMPQRWVRVVHGRMDNRDFYGVEAYRARDYYRDCSGEVCRNY